MTHISCIQHDFDDCWHFTDYNKSFFECVISCVYDTIYVSELNIVGSCKLKKRCSTFNFWMQRSLYPMSFVWFSSLQLRFFRMIFFLDVHESTWNKQSEFIAKVQNHWNTHQQLNFFELLRNNNNSKSYLWNFLNFFFWIVWISFSCLLKFSYFKLWYVSYTYISFICTSLRSLFLLRLHYYNLVKILCNKRTIDGNRLLFMIHAIRSICNVRDEFDSINIAYNDNALALEDK